MPLHPPELYLMAVEEGNQPFEEIPVGYRLMRMTPPMLPLQLATMIGGIDDIGRVGEERDLAWHVQGFEANQHREEFGPVIGGVEIAADDDFATSLDG